MATDQYTIYVQLLNEGTIAYRPTKGERVDDFIFKILPAENYDPVDEEWEFPLGKIVRCKTEVINDELALVAYEEL